MSRIAILLLLFFLFSCSTQEDVPCENGIGYLYKEDQEFACPFTLQTRAANGGWKDLEGGATILAYDVGDYFPLKMRNSPAMYRVKIVEYSTYAVIDGALIEGSSHECLFFGEREMPSYDWYHVLKVCDGRKINFMLMGEIKE